MNWDYTEVAADYAQRPPYAAQSISVIRESSGLSGRSTACDIGAGCGRLTRELAREGTRVTAVEPCEAMAALGRRVTDMLSNIKWVDATGEATGLEDGTFDLVTYGSSFHTVDRRLAVAEALRILKPKGWFACLWNHRDLNDPLQAKIEDFLMNFLPTYSYGARREDQTQLLQDCGLTGVQRFNHPFTDSQTVDQMMTHWRSHMTLKKMAGDSFPKALTAIERVLRATKQETVNVPYITRLWIGRKP